jgi:hypothetical protein
MSKVNIERKRAILDSAKGQFFTVEFVKKDGTTRIMTAKKWMEKAFTYGSANAQANTVAGKPEYYTAADASAGEFRNINLETLVRAKVAGIDYKFD